MREVSLSNMQESFEPEFKGLGEQIPELYARGHLSIVESLESPEHRSPSPLLDVEIDAIEGEKIHPPIKKTRPRRSIRSTDGRADDIVKTYLDDMGQYDLLTKEDEERLAIAREAGIAAQKKLAETKYKYKAERLKDEAIVAAGKKAEEKFIVSNLRLVVKIAKRYHLSGVPLSDLIQYGNMGLMHAVEKFDYRKGFKFSTYATWWIQQKINRNIVENERTVRVSVRTVGKFNEYNDVCDDLLELGIQNPTDEQISERLEMDPQSGTFKRLKELHQRYSKPVGSMDASGLDDDDRDKYDIIPDSSVEGRPEEEATKKVEFDELYELLDELDEGDREVIRLRFGLDRGEPRSFVEVGEHFNVNNSQARHMHVKAMARLRTIAEEKGLHA